MYNVYAVVILESGEKARHFIGRDQDEFLAKHLANRAVADYAYVKHTDGTTVYFTESPDRRYQTRHRQESQVLQLRP